MDKKIIGLAALAGLGFLYLKSQEATTETTTTGGMGGGGEVIGDSGGAAGSVPLPTSDQPIVYNFPNPDFPTQQESADTGDKKSATLAATLEIPSNFQPLANAQGQIIGFASPEGQSYTTLGTPVIYGETLNKIWLNESGLVVGAEDSRVQMSYALKTPTTYADYSTAPPISSKKTGSTTASTGNFGGVSSIFSPANVSSQYFTPASGSGLMSKASVPLTTSKKDSGASSLLNLPTQTPTYSGGTRTDLNPSLPANISFSGGSGGGSVVMSSSKAAVTKAAAPVAASKVSAPAISTPVFTPTQIALNYTRGIW